jgi:hypothetical protein
MYLAQVTAALFFATRSKPVMQMPMVSLSEAFQQMAGRCEMPQLTA